MSMISAQVDELRELATRCDELQVGAVKAVTMPSDMGSILRGAADTIWQLRDDLQRINAENAKLRELVRSAVRCITDVPDCDSCALGEQVSGVWVCHLIGAAKELGVEVDE